MPLHLLQRLLTFIDLVVTDVEVRQEFHRLLEDLLHGLLESVKLNLHK